MSQETAPTGTRPGKRPKRRSKLFWAELCDEYIHGIGGDDVTEPTFPSLEELSRRHDVSIRALAHHANAEGWVTLQDEYRPLYNFAQHRRRIEYLLRMVERFDEASFPIARLIQQEILRSFADLDRYREETGDHLLMPAQQLKWLARAALKAQKIGLLALTEERDKIQTKLNEGPGVVRKR